MVNIKICTNENKKFSKYAIPAIYTKIHLCLMYHTTLLYKHTEKGLILKCCLNFSQIFKKTIEKCSNNASLMVCLSMGGGCCTGALGKMTFWAIF